MRVHRQDSRTGVVADVVVVLRVVPVGDEQAVLVRVALDPVRPRVEEPEVVGRLQRRVVAVVLAVLGDVGVEEGLQLRRRSSSGSRRRSSPRRRSRRCRWSDRPPRSSSTRKPGSVAGDVGPVAEPDAVVPAGRVAVRSTQRRRRARDALSRVLAVRVGRGRPVGLRPASSRAVRGGLEVGVVPVLSRSRSGPWRSRLAAGERRIGCVIVSSSSLPGRCQNIYPSRSHGAPRSSGTCLVGQDDEAACGFFVCRRVRAELESRLAGLPRRRTGPAALRLLSQPSWNRSHAPRSVGASPMPSGLPSPMLAPERHQRPEGRWCSRRRRCCRRCRRGPAGRGRGRTRGRRRRGRRSRAGRCSRRPTRRSGCSGRAALETSPPLEPTSTPASRRGPPACRLAVPAVAPDGVGALVGVAGRLVAAGVDDLEVVDDAVGLVEVAVAVDVVAVLLVEGLEVVLRSAVMVLAAVELLLAPTRPWRHGSVPWCCCRRCRRSSCGRRAPR